MGNNAVFEHAQEVKIEQQMRREFERARQQGVMQNSRINIGFEDQNVNGVNYDQFRTDRRIRGGQLPVFGVPVSAEGTLSSSGGVVRGRSPAPVAGNNAADRAAHVNNFVQPAPADRAPE